MSGVTLLRMLLALLFLHLAPTSPAQGQDSVPNPNPADPVVRDPQHFDPKRLVAQELQTTVADGFTVAAVGDLIISRPVAQEAARLPQFREVLAILRGADVATGNLETSIFDPRDFAGAPYAWDGDWTNASLPGVAADLKAMGLALVARANNHVLDWGLEGMRETGRRLDEAGIVHAGTGEDRGRARAPAYFETARGRVALVSIASTFRPTTDALPSHDATPGRPGLSALHLSRTVELPAAAMAGLAAADCAAHRQHCGETPERLTLFDTDFRRADSFAYRYAMDPEDLAGILRAVRSARQNADFVIVAIHAHECSTGCDDDDAPRGPGDFLKTLAHAAIESGADLFVTTGNHNLGPVELYHSPRGIRPILYGLGNFFWSDVQEMLPHDLYQANRRLLEESWRDPEKATDYDLTAPLNRASFAHDFTFRSVIAVSRFDGNRLVELRLHPVELGYGARLTLSGIPRLATDRRIADAILGEIAAANQAFGLPALTLTMTDGGAVVRP